MMARKLKSSILLLLFLVTVTGLISIKHPILLKWINGTARFISKPIDAKVFTNNKINQNIKVFHNEKYWASKERANNYLLALSEFDNQGRLKFININLNENWIGVPVSTSKKDYDFIFGYLFQSETGGHFFHIEDEIKGFGYDSHLRVNGKNIEFDVPPNELKFDSIRIDLK